MADTFAEIPDRDAFKASEVCEIAKIQPYVLRSWEQEFPNLGVSRSPGSARIYRRGDVERVLRIKQLVFGEGLTLAGARRRLDGDGPGAADAELPAMLDEQARATLSGIKRELRALLELLDRAPAAPATRAGGDGRQPVLPDLAENGAWPPKAREQGRKAKGRPARHG